jgi:signal peptidase I
MDGRAHERDDFGETHNFPRFGHDSTPEDDAYADEVRSDIPPGADQRPLPFVPADTTPARWGEPDPESWKVPDRGRADSGRGDPGRWGGTSSGGFPSYGRLAFGGPPAREEPGHEPPPPYEPPPYEPYEPPMLPTRGSRPETSQPPAAQPPAAQPSPYERPGYGTGPSYGQPPYGQASYGQPSYEQPSYEQPSYEQPSYEQPSFEQPPYGQSAYGQSAYGAAPQSPPSGFGQVSPAPGAPTGFGAEEYRADDTGAGRFPKWRDGYGLDGPGTGSDGFPAIPFGGPSEVVDDRPLPAVRDAPDEPRSGFGGRRGRRGLGGEDLDRGGEVVAARPRRAVRRGRVSDEDDNGEGRARRSMPLWQELPLLLVVAFCLAVLIRTFLLQAFFIPSGSMEQTLLVGDRVLVNKIVYDVRPPERGEVVVFRGTDNWAPENFKEPQVSLLGRIGRTMGDLVGVSRPGEKDFIKRVIGLPGDRVSCCDPSGRVYVNGKGIDEPYVLNNSPLDVQPDPRVCKSRRFDEVLVPPGQIFVMGDHRIVSQDARCQGPVPIENVIGRAFVVVWPSSRWDTLNVPETFADVPGPVAIGPPSGAGTNVRVGAAVVTLPILASLVVTTRWGRKPRWGRRTLRK